jgi:hypothetical protein
VLTIPAGEQHGADPLNFNHRAISEVHRASDVGVELGEHAMNISHVI